MNTINKELEILLYDKNFGLITERQVIITKNNCEKKLRFESINKVNLIKKRFFYSNLFLFLTSCFIFVFNYLFLKTNQIIFYSTLGIGILFFLYAIIHKFYTYELIIKENNDKIHIIKTSELKKKRIKKFYFTLIKKTKR